MMQVKENTLVICTTDHGLAFPHEYNLNDHGTGVFFMLRWPDQVGGGRSLMPGLATDLYPTLCEWLNFAGAYQQGNLAANY